MGRGLRDGVRARARDGCCCPGRRFAPTRRRSRAFATTPTGSPSRTSPTPTPRPCATGSAGRSCFVAYDGTLSWRSGDDVIESSFETVLSAREASRRYRTAISTELPDGLPRILREADAKLADAARRRAPRRRRPGDRRRLRRTRAGSPRCCARRPAARRSSCCTPSRGRRRSSPRSRNSRDPWIVAVNMVSEGVDIPRLRVGVYATAAKTPLVFRQIVGRFVRTIPGRPSEPSWLYVPADPILRDHAADGRAGAAPRLRARRRRATSSSSTSRTERRETERAEAPAFVPLSADVAPQMTLFGPPPGAGRRDGGGTATAAAAGDDDADRASRVRAPRDAPKRAPPARVGGHPPRPDRPSRGQRLAQSQSRGLERRQRHARASSSDPSSCSSAGSPAVADARNLTRVMSGA